MIHHIKHATRHLLFWSLIIFAIAINSVRIFLLSIENYKTELEDRVREMTTIPIEIGKLRAHMRGFSVEMIINDIHVLATDENNGPAIKLDEMHLGINLTKLLFTGQVLPSSWLTLVGAKLSIVRKKDGSLSVAGLKTEDSAQPLWLLSGSQYKVLNSNITWLDEQHNGTPLEFNKVDFLVKNKFDSHEFHFISQLPKQYGKTLRVSASIQGNVLETDDINGMVYVEGSDIYLTKTMTGALPLGIKVMAGESSFKKWSKLEKSELSTMAGSVHAKNVVLQNKNKKSFYIKEITTRFNGLIEKDVWQLGVSDLLLETEAKKWSVAEFNFSINKDLTYFTSSVMQLDIQALIKLTQFFSPLETKQHVLLSKLDLKGLLKKFSIYADIENEQYAVNGVFENFFANAYSGFPKLENITGSIKGDNEKGFIDLDTHKASLFFPDLFRDSFSIKKMKALIEWQQKAGEWQLFSESLVLDTEHVQTETRATVTISKNDKPVFIDLQTRFNNVQDVSSAPQYYPVTMMDSDLLIWLDNAFVSGKVRQGEVLVYGELNKFPFSNGQGVFEAFFNFEELEVRHHPDWPHLKNVAAEVLFVKDSLSVNLTHAEVNNLEVRQAKIDIPSFEKSDYLLVQGQAEGSVLNTLTFLQKTPLHSPVDSVLDAITPTGLMQVELDLKIPLTDNATADVDGIVHLRQNSLLVNAIDLNVTDISGDLRFTENEFFADNIKAKTLGFPVNVKVDSENYNTFIKIEGKTDILQLKKQFGFLNDKYLDDGKITGSTTYKVKLDLPENKKQSAKLVINSDLLGVAIDLPGSLKKSDKEHAPVFMGLSLNKKKLLALNLNYNEQLKAAINISKQKNALHSAHIVYGNGEAVIPHRKGIKLQIEQDFFDISKWLRVLKNDANEEKQSELELIGLNMNIKQLQWNNIKYGPFAIAIQRFENEWLGNISCSAAKGAFSIPFNHSVEDKIKMDMAYLNLTELMSIDLQGGNFTVEDLPLIKLDSSRLWWNNANLGKLEIDSERLLDGVRFNQIDITSNDYTINLTADWIKNNQGSMSEVHGSLYADDVGKFLSLTNITDDIEEANAKIDYSGRWSGAPYQFSLEKMNANLDIEFKEGRISSIEPGFGRILGLIAMEQWIKRMTLDFDDLYKQGLSFNKINGHFQMTNGIATTKSLLVDAVSAQIAITGETDLLAKTFDLEMRVVPKSSRAVPIAGAIVSTITGAITQAFTNNYQEGYFFGSGYKITGEWDDIKVTSVGDHDGILNKTWTGLTDFSWMNPKSNSE